MRCIVAGCDRAAAGRRKMCRAHYERWRKYGSASWTSVYLSVAVVMRRLRQETGSLIAGR